MFKKRKKKKSGPKKLLVETSFRFLTAQRKTLDLSCNPRGEDLKIQQQLDFIHKLVSKKETYHLGLLACDT